MEIYKDNRYTATERAQDLLGKMTLDEKVEQIRVYNYDDTLLKRVAKGETDGFFGGVFFPWGKKNGVVEKLQKYARENTRLGIPLLTFGEGVHGYLSQKATVYPQGLGVACSFNEALVYEEAKEIGREASLCGIRQVFAPNIDVAREPRWGRVQETYGEDPYLVSKLGSAYVKGLQSSGVASTLKHFAGYSVPENGLNLSSAHLGEREMREIMFPAYKECIKAGAMSVMPAYNEVDGEPMHSSKKYLTDILKEEFGFDGTVISDWGGVEMLKAFHGVVETDVEAGERALLAGLDMEAPYPFGFCKAFKEKIKDSQALLEALDKAVLRVLILKFRLGLFEKESWEKGAKLRTKKSVRLARKIAEQSVVLLKNDGILPLNKEKINKLAVIGPNASIVQLGGYTFYPYAKEVVSLRQGLCDKLGGDKVLYARGCDIARCDEETIKTAVETAKQADVVVLALGDNSSHFGGVGWGDEGVSDSAVNCGEGFDVSSLDLPDAQKRLFNEVKKCGKPVVFLSYTGRPIAIKDEFENSNAVMQAWYIGEQGGNAMADLLFGDVNPTGKLCISFPRSVGHLPCYYNHRVSARGNFYQMPGTPEKAGRDYVFDSPKAFLPFGYGLSYTSYKYSGVKAIACDDGGVDLKVKIANVGERDGEEIVLAFIKREGGYPVPFEKELKVFKRVFIKAGKSKTVTLHLDKEAFAVVGKNYQTEYPKVKFTLLVGDKSVQIQR